MAEVENLYPNNGEYFTPFIQVDKSKRKVTINGRAEVNKAIKNLDAAITETDSIKEAMRLADTRHINLEVSLEVMRYANEKLSAERSKLLSILDK